MAPHVSEHITATAPAKQDLVGVPATGPVSGSEPRPVTGFGNRTPWFWSLLLLGTLLNVGILVLGYHLLFGTKTVEKKEDLIKVPYAADKALWAPWHSWVVQDNGRNKPFETFAKEAMRSLTGREQFEENDPVAIVVSWLMLYEPETKEGADGKSRQVNLRQANDNKINQISRAMGCDWDSYPFILCDHQELREKLYREYWERLDKDHQLTPIELHGKHIQPEVLRHSNVLKDLWNEFRMKKSQDAKAEIPLLESKAAEVARRLDMYERIRSGGEIEQGQGRDIMAGEFQIMALDRVSPSWFSLKSLRYYASLPTQSTDENALTQGMVWAAVMKSRKTSNYDLYEGTGPQPFPAADVQKVVDAFLATQQAYRSGNSEQFATATASFLKTIDEMSNQHNSYPNTATVPLEQWFNATNPFQKAWIFGLAATLVLALSVLFSSQWNTAGKVLYVVGMVLYLGSIAAAVVGFYCRISISGRPPVSNMYESIIWVAFMTAIFGLGLELVYRRGLIALAGGLVSTIAFVLADQMPTTFSPSIDPLTPVLRSNYWLIIHVLTIVSSYAALALAWGLGNFNMGLILLRPERRDLIKTLSMFSYRAIQVGVILLFAGTMLGGFWAAESWGRFWGWDPKEVWALIAFIFYMIPLHARYVGWVKDFGLAFCSVVCFAFVVMAWYGVNFILGAGLHAYGFGSGNNSWIYFFGLINLSLAVHAAARYVARSNAPVVAA